MIPWARRIETLCRVLALDTSSELTTMLAASLQVSSQQSVCEDRLVTRLRGDGKAVVFMVGGRNRGTGSAVGGRYSRPRAVCEQAIPRRTHRYRSEVL